MEVSITCPTCEKEIIVELEYEEINYDPRDGYTEYGYSGGIVDKEYRECQCDFTDDDENNILSIAQHLYEGSYD